MPPPTDDHLAPIPHGMVRVSTNGCFDCTSRRPAIRAGIVFSAGIYEFGIPSPAPDDHLAASPHRGGPKAGSGRIDSHSSCPSVSGRTVHSASVQAIKENLIDSTPDDHFTPGPGRGVIDPCRWRAVSADVCPTVYAGV